MPESIEPHPSDTSEQTDRSSVARANLPAKLGTFLCEATWANETPSETTTDKSGQSLLTRVGAFLCGSRLS